MAIYALLIIALGLLLSGCTAENEASVNTAEVSDTAAITDIEPIESEKDIMFDLEKEKISLYTNPIMSEAESSFLNCGDPFVMRYDGKYYLYCSSNRGDGKIYCHESTDLASWSDAVLCVPLENIPVITSEHGHYGIGSAYAPEVTYFNGKFYMVTSFGGMGHYVYTADSPTGPFEAASGNFGMTIDGDIFIDNDGKWYFYHADGGGIRCHEMTSPIEVSKKSTLTGSLIDDTIDGSATWSEGSMIVYHDGTYFMTYTGNHVMSNSYRIDYSINKKGGGGYFTPSDVNPLLISADVKADVHGIGHSSTVKGPDLDSYYIAYHAMSNKCGLRTFNVDRLYFNGETLGVMGPTTAGSQISFMPNIYSFFESADEAAKFEGGANISGGKLNVGADSSVMAKERLTGDRFTMEITVSELSGSGQAGAVFACTDDDCFGSALLDTASETLDITFVVDGKKTEYSHPLVRSFDIPYDFEAVQSIQIERDGGKYTFYVNDRELCVHESELNGGRFGVKCVGMSGAFGYFGVSAEASGSSNKRFYKPVSAQTGEFPAIFCTESSIDTGIIADTLEKFVVTKDGGFYNYRIYISEKGLYDYSVCYDSSGCALSLYIDGELMSEAALNGTNGEYMTEIIRGIAVSKGQHTMTVEVKGGVAKLLRMAMTLGKEVGEIEQSFDIPSVNKVFTYLDGTGFGISDGVLTAQGPGRAVLGRREWGDYTFEVDITPTSDYIRLGLLLRVTEICNTGLLNGSMGTPLDNSTARASFNWFKGYFAEFTATGSSVYKCRFNINRVGEADAVLEKDKTSRIRAVAAGANIKVYVDDALLFDYTDPAPFTNGMCGFRIEKGSAVIDNVRITDAAD